MEFKSDEKKTWLEDKNGKQIALLDHPEYADVLEDPDMERQKAEMLAGPACGLRR